MSVLVACVASVSARVYCESLNESEKKKEEGGGEVERKHFQANPTILKNAPYFTVGSVHAVKADQLQQPKTKMVIV